MGKARIIEWRKAVPSPLILVFGSEEYFSSSAIRRIRDQLRSNEPSLEIYEVEASEYNSGDLVNMISPSLFSDPITECLMSQCHVLSGRKNRLFFYDYSIKRIGRSSFINRAKYIAE